MRMWEGIMRRLTLAKRALNDNQMIRMHDEYRLVYISGRTVRRKLKLRSLRF
jgi:hypothetical protein